MKHLFFILYLFASFILIISLAQYDLFIPIMFWLATRWLKDATIEIGE